MGHPIRHKSNVQATFSRNLKCNPGTFKQQVQKCTSSCIDNYNDKYPMHRWENLIKMKTKKIMYGGSSIIIYVIKCCVTFKIL